MSNPLPPIPQDKIEENFKWRDWFRMVRSYILANRNYGQFFNTLSQTFGAANTVYQLALNTQDGHNNITLSGNRMTVSETGQYNIQYSLQMANTSTSTIGTVWVWLRQNGVDLANSASKFSVVTSHGGTDGYMVALSNIITDANAGDYFEVYIAVDTTAVFIEAYSAQTTPFPLPALPSSIVTINQLS
jgi:hypothetical protein